MSENFKKPKITILGSLRKAHIKKIAESLTANKIEFKVEPSVDGKMFMLVVNLRDAKKVVEIASKCIEENNLDIVRLQRQFWAGSKSQSKENNL